MKEIVFWSVAASVFILEVSIYKTASTQDLFDLVPIILFLVTAIAVAKRITE